MSTDPSVTIRAKHVRAGDELVAGKWRGGVVKAFALISSQSLFFVFEDDPEQPTNCSRPYATDDWVTVVLREDRSEPGQRSQWAEAD